MSKLWEVDPETRSKLQDIQKQNGNNVCVDCNAPSPQWASPKFGVFMCLNCSGIHRGLGVHISFVRSVTMDQFKVSELHRMSYGGNKPWQDFFNQFKENKIEGKTFDTATIKERYDSEAGEEWKERLTAKVEGKEYIPGQRTVPTVSLTPSGSGSRSQTPVGGREQSPAPTSAPIGSIRKVQNEAYFARMGEENATRPNNVPPSQGGKYGGFGSEPAPSASDDGDWLTDFSKDPMAGLTKGFGWLGKSAKTGYDGWVKPNVQKLAETDLSTQARLTAAQIARDLQAGTKGAAESFNRFVEGTEGGPSHSRSRSSGAPAELDDDKREFWDTFGSQPQGPDKEKEEFWDTFGTSPTSPPKEKREFWDSFGEAPKGPPAEKKDFWEAFGVSDSNAKPASSSSSIGTSAMKKAGTGNATGSGKDDEWNEW